MADLIDVSTIINENNELCGGPLLEAFQAINQFCTELEGILAQANPDGALLANGTVDATACLSYESDNQFCGGDNDIPSWSQVKSLFKCEKVTLTTGSTGEVQIPDVAGKIFLQLVEPVPVGVVSVYLNTDGETITALNSMGAPAPGEDICIQYLEYLG